MKILSLFEEYTGNSKVQPTTDLTNPWALDCNGNPILPENAERHGNYTCPKCHEPLNVRKRGKGEHSRRDHFYHKADTACRGFTPHETESYIHKTAKAGIFKILQSCIEKNEQFTVSWNCPTCGKQFNGNLLHHAKSVQIEKQFEDNADGQDHKQPDISLIDENGKLIVAIEIVYTHDIEPDTWEFYNANNIVVLRLKFETVEELNDLKLKLQNPDSVNVCLNVTCKECQTMHQPHIIHPLKNQQDKYFALSVAVVSPFEDILYWGLPFNDNDKHNADMFAKERWPNIPINLEYSIHNGIHFAGLRVQQQRIIQKPMIQRPQYRRTHLTLDKMEALGFNGYLKTIGGRYKSKSKTTSKSKPKTSSNYGKRSSGTNRSGGKRRK